MCRLRLGENTESIIYLLYVGMIIIIIHNVKSWSLVSSSSFLKVIKKTTKYSFAFVFCNIIMCYGGCKLPQIWTLWWGLTSHGWHLCKTCSKFVWESQICPKCEALWQVISVFEQRVKRISVKSWFEPLRPVMFELCEEKFLRIIHTQTI